VLDQRPAVEVRERLGREAGGVKTGGNDDGGRERT